MLSLATAADGVARNAMSHWFDRSQRRRRGNLVSALPVCRSGGKVRTWPVVAALGVALVAACGSAPGAQGSSSTPSSVVGPTSAAPADSLASPAASPSISSSESAAPSQPAQTDQVAYILGDSLTFKARAFMADALAERGWTSNPATDSRIGRMVEEGMAILAEQADLPSTVLIALGTNNWYVSATEASDWIAQARSLIGPDRNLIWVNVDMVGEKYSNFPEVNRGLVDGVKTDNRALRRAGASGRTYVADWRSYAEDNGIRHSHDGVHYKRGAFRQRMAFYAAVLAGDASVIKYLIS